MRAPPERLVRPSIAAFDGSDSALDAGIVAAGGASPALAGEPPCAESAGGRKVPGVLRTVRQRAILVFIWLSELVLTLAGRRRPYGILSIDLSGELAEEGNEQQLLGILRRPATDYFSLISLLRWAREDSHLSAVILRCEDFQASWARVQGIRRAIERLRAAGKRVWVHLDAGGVLEYYLASAAERISLPPSGRLDVTGLSSEAVFLLGALEKVGIKADLVQMGRYKSAAEIFTRRDMSPAHREMIESLVDDLYGQLIDGVAAGRGLDPAAVRETFDGGPFLVREATAARLIDHEAYYDEVEAELVEACGGAAVLDRQAYGRRRGREIQRQVLRHPHRTLALVHVSGTIKSGESIPGPDGASAVGSTAVAAALKEVRERDDVRGVILRVASPGGSGLASDLMWREIVRTREKKPVVVSCGDLAASGGYYVAVAGGPILAEPGTITGSIGVVAGKANLRQLYDRVGVTKELVTRGRNAKIHSDYEPLGEQERERIQAEASSFYGLFLDRVATARHLSVEAVASAAEGRVWTGRQAWTRGLIDELGGLEEALDAAKKMAGLPVTEPVAVERFPRPRRLWKLSFDLNLPSQRVASDLLASLPALRFLLRERVWTILPFHLRFF
jgi:protease-4